MIDHTEGGQGGICTPLGTSFSPSRLPAIARASLCPDQASRLQTHPHLHLFVIPDTNAEQSKFRYMIWPLHTSRWCSVF